MRFLKKPENKKCTSCEAQLDDYETYRERQKKGKLPGNARPTYAYICCDCDRHYCHQCMMNPSTGMIAGHIGCKCGAGKGTLTAENIDEFFVKVDIVRYGK